MSLHMWLKRTKVRSTEESDEIIVETESRPRSKPRSRSNSSNRPTESPTADECEQASTSTESPRDQGRKKAEKATLKRKINQRWFEEFEWLDQDNGKLTCKLCTRASDASNAIGRRLKSNSFVKGSTNFQRSALTRHRDSDDHALAKSMLQQKKAMHIHQIQMAEATTDSLLAQMNTAVMMAEQDIPDTKFPHLLSLQKRNGLASLQKEEQWYKGHESCKEMQGAAAAVCEDRIKERLQASPFLGIMVDESLDLAVQKKLVIYFKLVKDGKPCLQFDANIEVMNGKAETIVTAIREYLSSLGIPLSKIIGMGTDGANVMIGRVNGVTTVLKRLNPTMISVWCCAHRMALMAHWAANAVQDIKKIQDTLVSIFKYFKYSAVRNNKLKELKGIMMEKVKKFKKPTAVRWLSLHEAVDAAERSWGCLVLTLENEATSKEGDTALALSLLKKVKTYNFIAMLCVLKDVLDPLMKCSKSFQKDHVDIELCMSMLQATLDTLSTLPDHPGPNVQRLHESLENEASYQNINFTITDKQKESTRTACNSFIKSLISEKVKRFPDGDMLIVKTLDKVLNPKHLPHDRNQIIEYGHQHLQDICKAFPQLDTERTKHDYRMFKFMLNNNREENLQQICERIINNHTEQFPDFSVLANVSLVIPLTSVPCERAFSVQNSVLNKKRNRLNNLHLNNKMIILSESRFSGEDIASAAAKRFISDKQRRK